MTFLHVPAAILGAMVLAQGIEILLSDFYLHLYFFCMVTLAVWSGFASKSRDHAIVGMMLFSSYILENNPDLWNHSHAALALAHAAIGGIIVSMCHQKVASYFAGIYSAKALVGGAMLFGLGGLYQYHVALNALSIIALIWFMDISLHRRRLVIEGVVEDTLSNQLRVVDQWMVMTKKRWRF